MEASSSSLPVGRPPALVLAWKAASVWAATDKYLPHTYVPLLRVSSERQTGKHAIKSIPWVMLIADRGGIAYIYHQWCKVDFNSGEVGGDFQEANSLVGIDELQRATHFIRWALLLISTTVYLLCSALVNLTVIIFLSRGNCKNTAVMSQAHMLQHLRRT